MSVTSLHNEEEDEKDIHQCNDKGEVYEIIPYINLIRNSVVETLNKKLKIAAYISTVYYKG